MKLLQLFDEETGVTYTLNLTEKDYARAVTGILP